MEQKTIRQPVLNTLKRLDIDIPENWEKAEKITIYNRFGGGSCQTLPFIADLINWVYLINNLYDMGNYTVKLSDFDRIKYFILDQDSNAYMTCLD